MPEIREVIVVEGRYDKNALRQVVDAVILETSGFGVFKSSAVCHLDDGRIGVTVHADRSASGLKASVAVRCGDYLAVKHANHPLGVARAVFSAEHHHVAFPVDGDFSPTIHIVGERLDSCAFAEDVAESVLATLVECDEFFVCHFLTPFVLLYIR